MAITAIATDTGSSSSDFITNDTTLTVSGTNGALSAGEKIQVSSDGGTTWTDVVQNGTSWSLVDATSASVELHLPGADRRCSRQYRHHREPCRHHRHRGTGGGAGDHGNCRQHRKHGYADGLRHQRRPRAAGEKIQLSSDGGATWTDVVQNGTSWSLVDGSAHPSSFTYQARIIDTAGNIGTTASQAFTGENSSGIVAENLNPASPSNVTVNPTGNILGAYDGIKALTFGTGNVTITSGGANITGTTRNRDRSLLELYRKRFRNDCCERRHHIRQRRD